MPPSPFIGQIFKKSRHLEFCVFKAIWSIGGNMKKNFATPLRAVSVETRELRSAKLLAKKLSVVDVLKVDWKPAFSRAELL